MENKELNRVYMGKPKIYIETTIPNFFFDFRNQSTEKKIDTIYFWENNLNNFQAITSMATIRELEETPNKKWKKSLLHLVADIKTIKIDNKIIRLARQYVEEGLIPKNYSADAVHLASAIVCKIDYLLTWNIQHLAHPLKRKSFRDYNISRNLYVTEIVTPQELNYHVNNNG